MSETQPTLSSGRLILTPVNPSHMGELTALFRNASVRRYLLDDELVSEQWVAEEINASRKRFEAGSAGLWIVQETGNEQIIGFTGFREFFDPPELQLLYGLLPLACGRGFATEAAMEVIAYAFAQLGFDSVVAATDVPNEASVRVMKRLGMSRVRRDGDVESGTLFYELKREAARPK